MLNNAFEGPLPTCFYASTSACFLSFFDTSTHINTYTHAVLCSAVLHSFVYVYATPLSSWMLNADKLISLSRLSASETSGQTKVNIQTENKLKEQQRGEEDCLVPLLRSWKWISAVAFLSGSATPPPLHPTTPFGDAAVCHTKWAVIHLSCNSIGAQQIWWLWRIFLVNKRRVLSLQGFGWYPELPGPAGRYFMLLDRRSCLWM